MERRCFRRQQCLRLLTSAVMALMILPKLSYASTSVNLTSPTNGSTVSGTVTVVIAISSSVSWADAYIDGNYFTSSPPFIFNWDSRTVGNGKHTISVTVFNSYNAIIGSSSVSVNVVNISPRLSITNSGTSTKPLIFDGHGSMSRGFDVTGSYIVIQNWDISMQASGNAAYGVFLHNGAHNVTIQSNTIHDLCAEGVYMDSSVSSISVTANTIYRASQSGVKADGQYATISSNDISRTTQYPDRLGGIFAACQELSGADADGIRFFGSGHVFTYNKLHDIPNGGWGSASSPNPHTDCFQTWGASGETTSNVLFQYNDCRGTATTGVEISSLEALAGPVGTISYKYNTFANMTAGINIDSNVGTVIFDHNSVAHILEEILIYNQPINSSSTITNNIFYDVGSGGDSYTTSLNPTISNNDCVMANGSPCGSYPVRGAAASLSPQFASLGSGTNPWLSLDFHLQSTSPVPTMGAFPLQ
jgi:hypothetical protein